MSQELRAVTRETPPAVKRPFFIINPAEAEKSGSLIPPLGLALINSALKSHGYQTSVIDLTFDTNLEQVKEILAKGGIYLITFTTTLVPRVQEVIRIIRAKDPAAYIVGGGAHPVARKEHVFDDVDMDAVALGEIRLTELADALHSTEPDRGLAGVQGLIFKSRGSVHINPPVDSWVQLDSLPLPDYHAFPVEKYFSAQGFRAVALSTSRGCPYRCTFCQPILFNLFGKKVRYASPARVVDEVEHLVKTLNVDFLIFVDDTFAFYQDRVVEICKEIVRRKIHVLWRCQTRVGLRRDVLEWMKRAGCFLIAFGVESGSQKILDTVDKDATVEMAEDTFRHCKELGILTHAFLMIGNIGETQETLNDTLKLAEKIKPSFYCLSIATPYPGTYLHEYAKANDIIMDADWDHYDHILTSPVVQLSQFTHEDLTRIKKEMELKINDEQETVRDITRLLFDTQFLRLMLRSVLRNPTMPFRMMRLAGRAIWEKSYGFRVSNPLTKA